MKKQLILEYQFQKTRKNDLEQMIKRATSMTAMIPPRLISESCPSHRSRDFSSIAHTEFFEIFWPFNFHPEYLTTRVGFGVGFFILS